MADGESLLQSWLYSESTYRLTVEKAKDAKEGASFAQNEYEKWNDAHKQAKKDLDVTLARHAQERLSLADERELIKQIMRFIGVLHDVKASDKSIAAGGRDSDINPETGMFISFFILKLCEPSSVQISDVCLHLVQVCWTLTW